MNELEYNEFRAQGLRLPTISVDDVGDQERTLAYGYNVDRDSWHAYVLDGEINVLTYQSGASWRAGQILGHAHGYELEVMMLSPNKRVYPDTVDLRFAVLMRNRGDGLPYIGNFNFNSPEAIRRQASGNFKGRTHYDF